MLYHPAAGWGVRGHREPGRLPSVRVPSPRPACGAARYRNRCRLAIEMPEIIEPTMPRKP